MPRHIPSRNEITDDTPLRLEVAAELGWPGGGMTAAALRREIGKGRLAGELAAGKYWVTLAGIKAFRALCRVKVKEPVPMPPRSAAVRRSDEAYDNAALAALNRTVTELSARRTEAIKRERREANSRRKSKV